MTSTIIISIKEISFSKLDVDSEKPSGSFLSFLNKERLCGSPFLWEGGAGRVLSKKTKISFLKQVNNKLMFILLATVLTDTHGS